MSDDHTFLLQKVQPAMVGLVDGSLSTLAPIFSIALATHNTRYAFIAGLATALGAGVSMAFSEGLSDTGELTGRASPPELAADARPAGAGHLAAGPDERLDAHLGTPPLRPAEPEPRLADLDRAAARDGHPFPGAVEDEDCEEDADDERHRPPPPRL